MIKNRFRNDAETLGAWKTASHLTASGGGSDSAALSTSGVIQLRITRCVLKPN